jgi:hypothetical protein
VFEWDAFQPSANSLELLTVQMSADGFVKAAKYLVSGRDYSGDVFFRGFQIGDHAYHTVSVESTKEEADCKL